MIVHVFAGTGLYTGAQGYMEETNLDLGYGPGIPTNGYASSHLAQSSRNQPL